MFLGKRKILNDGLDVALKYHELAGNKYKKYKIRIYFVK